MKIILIGSEGKMGKKMQKLLKEKQISFLPIDKPNRTMADSFDADVILDFSSSECLKDNLALAKKKCIPIVLATTNHSQENLFLIDEAKKKIPIFMSSNFSLMFQVMLKLISGLESLNDCDFAVVETHHKHKTDVPSGSCLEIMKKLSKIDVKPQVSSLRVGEIVGIHDLQIFSKNETLQIKHQVFDRQVFCEGALLACEFVVKQKNGFYDMQDLIKQ